MHEEICSRLCAMHAHGTHAPVEPALRCSLTVARDTKLLAAGAKREPEPAQDVHAWDGKCQPVHGNNCACATWSVAVNTTHILPYASLDLKFCHNCAMLTARAMCVFRGGASGTLALPAEVHGKGDVCLVPPKALSEDRARRRRCQHANPRGRRGARDPRILTDETLRRQAQDCSSAARQARVAHLNSHN